MASGVGESRSRGGQQRGDWEVGDWVCPSCHAINFKRRSSCLKCGVSKPEAFEQAVPYAPLGDGKKAASKKTGAKGDEMWCELCLIECPGQASYTEHCRGKKHRAALRAMQGEPAAAPAVVPNVTLCKPCAEVGKGDEWSIAVKKSSGGKATGNAGGAKQQGGGQNVSSKHQEAHRSNTQPGEWEEGDWVCSECRWINFKKRDTCLKCPNLVSQENFEQATPFVQPGESKKHSSALGVSAGNHSKERPRWCELCKVECPGEISYNEHCAGKKHLAKARQSRQPLQSRAGLSRQKSEEVLIALPRPREAAWNEAQQQGRNTAEQPYKLEASRGTGEPTSLGGLVSKKMTFAEALSGGCKSPVAAAQSPPAAASPKQAIILSPTSPENLSIGHEAELGGFAGFSLEEPMIASPKGESPSPGGETWGMRSTALWGLPQEPADLGGDLWTGAGLAGLEEIAQTGSAPKSPNVAHHKPVSPKWQSEPNASAEKPQETSDNIWKSASDNAAVWGQSYTEQGAPYYDEQEQETAEAAEEQVAAGSGLQEERQEAPGMWQGAQTQQWTEGKGGGANGHGPDDRQGIWDPNQQFGATPTVNAGPGAGHIVSWDHQMGYAQTREGFLVLVSVYDISNGAVPAQGQQVRWQSLQQDGSGQGYRAVNVELLTGSELQANYPRDWQQAQGGLSQQYAERDSEEVPWGNGTQMQQGFQQHGGFVPQGHEFSKHGYGQHMYAPQQVHQQMGYQQQGQPGWGQQGNLSWGQQGQQGYAQQGQAYNRAGFGGAGSYWGGAQQQQQQPQQQPQPQQHPPAAQGAAMSNGIKMGSSQQYAQASSVWSQPNNNHGMDQHTTMSWGGAQGR